MPLTAHPEGNALASSGDNPLASVESVVRAADQLRVGAIISLIGLFAVWNTFGLLLLVLSWTATGLWILSTCGRAKGLDSKKRVARFVGIGVGCGVCSVLALVVTVLLVAGQSPAGLVMAVIWFVLTVGCWVAMTACLARFCRILLRPTLARRWHGASVAVSVSVPLLALFLVAHQLSLVFSIGFGLLVYLFVTLVLVLVLADRTAAVLKQPLAFARPEEAETPRS